MLEVGTSRKTEIRQLDMVILVDKDVVCFDVPESRNKYGMPEVNKQAHL